jgi:hypothetical protein
VDCSAEDDECNDGVCNEANSGACEKQPANEGGSCGDGTANECTDPDTCEAGECVANNKPCAFVTDSSLCPFDVSELACGETGRQFRTVLTPSPRDGWPSYKLNASNPGQYFYNLIVEGAPFEEVTVDIDVPYPFVTQGATPLHVYDAALLEFDSYGCFLPQDALQSLGPQIAIEDYIGGVVPNGGFSLTCDQVGCGLDAAGACSFSAPVTIPESGQAYVTLHLDYGLKGASLDANDGADITSFGQTTCDTYPDRYDLGAPGAEVDGGWDALKNTETDDGPIAISNCKSYPFSHECSTCVDTSEFSDQVQSLNIFKRIKGVYGPVMSSDTESPVSGAWVEVFRVSTGELVASGVSDEDGYYAIPYKHTGKRAMYDIALNGGEITQRVQLKANGWAEVSFDVFTGTSTGYFASSDTGGGRGGPGSCTATETPEVSCNDGVDNDCDGDTDMVDVDCNGGFCTDAQLGDACTDDADCCSNKCRGKLGTKVCK